MHVCSCCYGMPAVKNTTDDMATGSSQEEIIDDSLSIISNGTRALP